VGNCSLAPATAAVARLQLIRDVVGLGPGGAMIGGHDHIHMRRPHTGVDILGVHQDEAVAVRVKHRFRTRIPQLSFRGDDFEVAPGRAAVCTGFHDHRSL
jgi:hypothetical protein